MFRAAIPVLHVQSSKKAEEFYCGKLGFTLRFAYRIDKNKADPCYMGFERDGVWLHVSSFSGDGVSGSCVYLAVDDVDTIYEQLKSAGVDIDTPPVDQDWGNREMYVRDPDFNSIRFTVEKE
jgi:uncharacterized glyoxalase superfamily protein PhnB